MHPYYFYSDYSLALIMSESINPSLISYQSLRRILGILGIVLPILLYFGNRWIFGKTALKVSMSSYYYTGMGDVFVGVLCAYGLFLFTYKGYEQIDNIIGIFAGIFALGVALFPTGPENTTRDLIGWIHIISTMLFYSMLTIYSLYLFRKKNPKQEATPRKLRRNKVYLICGVFMIISILLIGIISIFDVSIPIDNPTFWLEAIANTFFGISWLVKGNGIRLLND